MNIQSDADMRTNSWRESEYITFMMKGEVNEQYSAFSIGQSNQLKLKLSLTRHEGA
jgi:hypothetical protein